VSDDTLVFLLFTTARIAVVIFLGAFTAAPLGELWPSAPTRWLSERERPFTLGFVIAHTIHLGFIGALAASHGAERFAHETGAPVLIGGAIVYLFVLGLGIISIWPAPPSKRPSRFRSVALWIVGAALARPLIVRAIQWRSPIYLPFSLAFLVAFTLRIAWAARAPRAAPAPEGPS
jgi:hypothetical protein